MRKHEWETLSNIYTMVERLTLALERMADHFAGPVPENEPVEATVQDSPSKVKRVKKLKDTVDPVSGSEEISR